MSLPALAGCVSLSVRVHRVPQTVVATGLLDASLSQLVQKMNSQYAAIQTLSASVTITADEGGQHEGEVKEIPTFAGYMTLRKPADLRVLLLLPVLRSRALDMVTDGTDFKLLIPPKNRAIVGTDKEVEHSATPPPAPHPAPGAPASALQSRTSQLDTIRPYIIRDALLIPALGPNELIVRTQSQRIQPPARGRKETVELHDYDLTVLRKASAPVEQNLLQNMVQIPGHGSDQALEVVRVIHIDRLRLQPYQQDIYDHQGRIVTTVQYSNYQRVDNVDYPLTILITRPIDEYSLKIEITKLQINPRLDDEQFVLKIPDNVPIQKM